MGSGNSSFILGGGTDMFDNRCVEALKCDYCSDVHYSHGLSGCQECMFSFSLRSKRYCIGNLELPKDKYLSIKSKLMAELAQILTGEKRLPRLIDIIASERPDYAPMKAAMKSFTGSKKGEDRSIMETAFTETTQVALGKPRFGIEKHKEWLLLGVNPIEEQKSCATGETVLLPEHSNFMLFPRGRLVNLHEAYHLGEKLKISQEQADSLTIAGAGKAIAAIAYLCPDWEMGNTANIPGCIVAINSNDCYGCILPLNSKQCGVCYWPRDSEHLFGINELKSSNFCISCFHSERLSRCFEVDSSNNCSDCLFCHNCENVHDSMFCFNVKNLKNAIGNVEFPREKYLEIKARILAEINTEIDRTGGYSRSVMTIGTKGESAKAHI
jgi:hypothetical protein